MVEQLPVKSKSRSLFLRWVLSLTREIPGVALVNCAISHIFTIILIVETVIFIHFSMHGLCLGPYLGGEGMHQKSENMWSFPMTPL